MKIPLKQGGAVCDDHSQYLSRFKILPFSCHFFVKFIDQRSLFRGGAVTDDQFGNFEKPSYSGGAVTRGGAVPVEFHGTYSEIS